MAGTKRLGAQYKEYKKLGQADAQFHQAIVDSAGNEVLSEVYASKQTHFARWQTVSTPASRI